MFKSREVSASVCEGGGWGGSGGSDVISLCGLGEMLTVERSTLLTRLLHASYTHLARLLHACYGDCGAEHVGRLTGNERGGEGDRRPSAEHVVGLCD